MGQPRTIKHGERSGVDVTYVQSSGMIYIGGWYDSMVGIKSLPISLKDFCLRLGITEAAVKKALYVPKIASEPGDHPMP